MEHEVASAVAVGFNTTHLVWAVLVGVLSAVSLPLGSAVGIVTPPRKSVTAMLAAFGAGALIAALAIELVAPTVQALHGEHGPGHGDPVVAFAALLIGSIAGGILFVVLDQMVNAHGGFLRKTALTISHMTQARTERNRRVLEQLSGIELLRKIPPDRIQDLVDVVEEVQFLPEEVLFEQGETGDCLFFIHQGQIELFEDGRPFKTLESGTVVGEIALLTGAPRTAKAIAKTQVDALVLRKTDFDRIRKESPELDREARSMASERLGELRTHKETRDEAARQWSHEAARALREGNQPPSAAELQKMREEYHGSPLAIWLGILLDGIPESLVIGAGVFGLIVVKSAAGSPGLVDVIPYTLIAGLFLSNFPEALSSSVGMRMQGYGPGRILGMWISLVVITGLGAGLGYAVGESLPHSLVIAVEGIAAGAMLTMIASTMLPEAVHLGGPSVVGLSTLVGFLGAISFKLLE